jgi:hypothetical protein
MQILGVIHSGPGVPTAPTSLSAAPGVNVATISFTTPSSDGGSAITNYEYSFNNSTWTALSPADTISPVSIAGLDEFTAYTVYLRAVNANGSGASSSGVSFTQLIEPTSNNPQAPFGGIYENPATISCQVTPKNIGYTLTNIGFERSLTSNFASVTFFAATPSSVSSGNSSTTVSATISFPTNGIYYWMRPRYTIAGETFTGRNASQLSADY